MTISITHIDTCTNFRSTSLAGDGSGREKLRLSLLMSNPAVLGCLLLSGQKIGTITGTITCKHGCNGCGARQEAHR